MPELADVTLCCIDTVQPALALRALRQSSSDLRFARTLLLTDRAQVSRGLEVRLIAPLPSRHAYSEFVLKSLLGHIDTAHVLLIQWDGYVVNPDSWQDKFLDCDYIGAKWFWHSDGMRVGNGGFSLRSRKLLQALQDRRVVLTGNEDETICRVFRPLLEREHGIVFGSEELADQFAFEAAYPVGRPFGFHGLYNFCRVMPQQELIALVPQFTPAIASSLQLRQLARNCLAMVQRQAAAAILHRIVEAVPEDEAAAASLAALAASASTRPAAGRNEPCPCGSGKRYKHCHGVAGPAAPAVVPQPSVDARLASALALHRAGESQAAERVYRDVLATQPGHAVAQHFLGVIEYQRGNLAAALPLLERAVASTPTEPEFHNNLALAYAAADRELDAVGAYRAALALKSDHALAWNNLGLALQSLNDVARAIAAFRRAIEVSADFAQAHWNLSLALLLDGRYEEGWREYDWRLELPELGKGRHRLPGSHWDGSPPAGKTLLLYPEQGLGDALQFARYATLVADAGGRCVIRCSDALSPLLSTIAGVSEVCREDEPPPRYDAHVPLLSLPGAFRTTQETIPATVPYIAVADSKCAAARAMLGRAGSGRNVGLAWAGNPAHPNDRHRSLSLSALASWFTVPGLSWFSLQQGDAVAQVGATPAAAQLVPLAEGSTLVDTAALITALDLVISVDTSIVHLAGALARPAWVLLPFAPDWRWRLDREDCPWYPTLRLFRQPRTNDWASVVLRILAQLRELAQR